MENTSPMWYNVDKIKDGQCSPLQAKPSCLALFTGRGGTRQRDGEGFIQYDLSHHNSPQCVCNRRGRCLSTSRQNKEVIL